jgi:hypothetical protein
MDQRWIVVPNGLALEVSNLIGVQWLQPDMSDELTSGCILLIKNLVEPSTR